MDGLLTFERDYGQLVLLVNALVLTAILAYGLKQLRLTKTGIQVQSDRSAKERAIEYASRFLRDYVEISRPYTTARIAAGLPTYRGPIGDFTPGSIPAENFEDAKRRILVEPHFIYGMNELAVVAAAFSSGVADEQTGFEIIGRTYCATVASHYDLLSLARRELASNHYEPIVRLYRLWAPRLTKSELLAERKLLDERIANIPDRIGTQLGPGRSG